MTWGRAIVRDLWARRASISILMTLEAIGVAALFVSGTLIHAVLSRPVPFPHAFNDRTCIRASGLFPVRKQAPAIDGTLLFLKDS
jgi:hypothetical protein